MSSTELTHRGQIVRSVRIRKELDDRLERYATLEGVTVSSLVSNLIEKHLEWDRQTEKYGYVTVPRELLAAILHTGSEERIATAAEELGSRLLKEMLWYWLRDVSVEALFTHLKLLSRYSGMATFEVDSNEHGTTLTIQHQMGRKWSVFVGNLYCEGIRASLGIESTVELGQNQVIIRWKH